MKMRKKQQNVPNKSGILWGATQIAHEIGRSNPATYRLIKNGTIPARRVGGEWAISRAELYATLGIPRELWPTVMKHGGSVPTSGAPATFIAGE